MRQRYIDRYRNFKDDGNYKPIPGINIPKKNSDLQIPYKLGETRLDIISQKYYKSPYFGWLIMLANQQYGGIEFMIPNNSLIRIPFPLQSSINDYFSEVEEYIKLYG